MNSSSLDAYPTSDATPPIPIANAFGWTSTIPNPMTCRWLEYLKTLEGPLTIDIGAGLGVGTIPALESGARVIANDIAEDHLNQIAAIAKQKGLGDELQLLNAPLPRLPPMKDIDAIHASNVLHFLRGIQMTEAATWMADALRPGGKVFIQTLSPFAGHFRRFSAEYDQRKCGGILWPGEINGAQDYVDQTVREMTPDFMHVLESSSAKQIFAEAGFVIEYCDYYTRPGLPMVCRLDGRENLGLVAVKQ